MRIILVLILSVSIFQKARSQPVPDGLWNAGGIYFPKIVSNAPDIDIKYQNPVIMANLYPGFAVVKTSFDLYNSDTLPCKVIMIVPDSGSMADPATAMVQTRPSSVTRLFADDSLVKSMVSTSVPGWQYEFVISAKKTMHLNIYQLTQNNQARLYREGESRPGNAFSISCSPLHQQDTTPLKVLVRFMDPLTLTNILGVSPGKKTKGDLRHLQFEPTGAVDAPLVIWYEGAPPDFKFTKNILPNADLLFSEMDKFPETAFNNPSFAIIDRFNFSTNPKNPLAAILYFMMFFTPWIILIGFIIFLLKKPKKKNIEA